MLQRESLYSVYNSVLRLQHGHFALDGVLVQGTGWLGPAGTNRPHIAKENSEMTRGGQMM